MYEVLNKDMMKSKILPHLFVAKCSYVSENDLAETLPCIRYMLKTGSQWHITFAFALCCLR